MKFESKLGVGEVVIIGSEIEKRHSGGVDYLGKIVGVRFEVNDVCYLVDCQFPAGMQRQWYSESDLIGDPNFDQVAGKYPPDD